MSSRPFPCPPGLRQLQGCLGDLLDQIGREDYHTVRIVEEGERCNPDDPLDQIQTLGWPPLKAGHLFTIREKAHATVLLWEESAISPDQAIPYFKATIDSKALLNALQYYGLSLGLPTLGGIAGHLGGRKLTSLFTKNMPRAAKLQSLLASRPAPELGGELAGLRDKSRFIRSQIQETVPRISESQDLLGKMERKYGDGTTMKTCADPRRLHR